MITIQNYVRAKSLEEAWQLNQKKRNRIVGGMLWMKMGRGSLDTAIDLCNLNLSGIEETETSFIIGAMTPLRALEMHEGLNRYSSGAVNAALRDIVGVQFRNLATVGGSLWGRYGFSDVLNVLLCMDTEVELYKGGTTPLEAFRDMPYDNDILVRVIIHKTTGRFAYRAMRISKTDFPVLNCTAAEVGGEIRVSIGARPGKAMLLRDKQKLLAGGLTEESIAAFADYASENTPTFGNIRGSSQYRTHLVRVLTERALREVGGLEA